MFRILIIYFIFLVSTQNTFSKEIHCSIDRVTVIDADTLKFCDLKIRLNGISAAERGHITYDSCKIITKKIIHKSDEISCELTGEKTYDRFVGICKLINNNIIYDLQEKIVESGCARDCERYSDGRYAKFETDKSRNLPLPNYCN
jgi:micrococcal nuclease